MRILVTGSTGFIGRHLVWRLEAEGHEVVCAGRRREQLEWMFPNHRHVLLDYNRISAKEDWRPYLREMDVVINAVGVIQEADNLRFDQLHTVAATALFDACFAYGVKQVIQVSALGADHQAGTRYHLSKRLADTHLARLDHTMSSMRWTILRPSIVYGPGSGSTLLFAALAALPLVPRLGKGDDLIQPVYIGDLDETVARLIDDPKPPEVLDVVGPAAITSDQLLLTFRRWLGLGSTLRLPIPSALLRLVGHVGDLLRTGPVNSETVIMLQRGNVSDPEPLIQHLKRPPVDLQTGLSRFPAEAKERQHARLFFLKLPLRLSLALLWIVTSIVSFGIYPAAESFALLARAGIEGDRLPGLLLYGGAAWDLALGLALLSGRHIQWIGLLQIMTVLVFTMIISVAIPGEWLHPFGPVTKNIPIIAAILVMMAMEER